MHFWKTYWLPLACAAIALLKLGLCAGLPLCVHAGAAYDDAWAVRAADFISQGAWLGPYDDITLIKNPGFPLWLALCTKLCAGYLVSTAVLYMLACTAFCVGVRPLVKNDLVFLALFALLAFNPVSFATDTYQRVYRNSISAAQALLVFGSFIALYLRVKRTGEDGKPALARIGAWSVLAAVSLAWLWLSREDSIWVAPFAVVAAVVTIVAVVRRGELGVSVKVACAVLAVFPLGVTLCAVQGVKAINDAHYGVTVTAEINSANFARMVKDLYAIDPAQLDGNSQASGGMPQNQRVAVTHAALLRAYEASPTLASISDCVEDEFLSWGDTVDNDPGDGEVNGGEFFWVIRRAARDAGIYDSASDKTPAQRADDFYGAIAQELEDALGKGVLPQRATMPSSIMTPWRAEFAAQLVPTFAEIAVQALAYSDVEADAFVAQGSEDGIDYFERITGNQAFRGSDAQPLACVVANGVIWLYRILGPLIALAGLIGLIRIIASFAASRAKATDRNTLLLVVVSLVLGAGVLIAGLAYSRVSSFIPISFYYYGSAAYPLLLAANILSASTFLTRE